MILSDRSIKEEIKKGTIKVDPYDEANVQPSSIDVHLDKKFLVFNHADNPYIDVRAKNEGLTTEVKPQEGKPFILHTGEFVLGTIKEVLELPNNIAARIEGKSSLGRLGLLIHSTAGFVDPGWKGKLTLELSNVSKLPITLYPGMKIGQISFMQMTTPVDNPYGSPSLGSKYHGDTEPMPSKMYENFKK